MTISLLVKLMGKLHVAQETTTIMLDNSGTVDWADDGPSKHFARRKHIDIKLNRMMQLIDERGAKLMKFQSVKLLADVLTKSLAQS